MLILTRKPGESLYIGDDIKITIVELKGHQIRVGIDAPKEKRIYREEIYLQILEENKSAAATPAGFELGLENVSAAWTQRSAPGGGSGSSAGSEGAGEPPKRGGFAGLSRMRASGSPQGGAAPRSSSTVSEGVPEAATVEPRTEDPETEGSVARSTGPESVNLGSIEGPRQNRVRRDLGSADVPVVVVRRKRPKKVDE